MPDIASIHHVSLTVTDLDRSVAWYKEVLGLGELMREDHPDGNGYAVVLGKPDFSMCVGLHTHSANASEPCNETRTGLDHVSFGVAQRADLDTWAEHFKTLNVSQSPINDREGYTARTDFDGLTALRLPTPHGLFRRRRLAGLADAREVSRAPLRVGS